jgi:hypothetical protein
VRIGIPLRGRCKEEALQGSKYCILHVDLPEDEESDEFKRINQHRDFIKAWQASKRYSELSYGQHSLQHSHGNKCDNLCRI